MVWWKFNNKCRHFPHFQKGTNRQTTIWLISFYMLFFNEYFYMLFDELEKLFLYIYLFFLWEQFLWTCSFGSSSSSSIIWERESGKKWGTKLVNVRKQNADVGLVYFGFGDCQCHGLTGVSCKRSSKKPPPLFFFPWDSETRNLHSSVRKTGKVSHKILCIIYCSEQGKVNYNIGKILS